MNRSQRKIIGATVIAAVLIIAAGVGIWATFLNDDAPEPVSLQRAVASLATATPDPADTDSDPTPSPAARAGETVEATTPAESTSVENDEPATESTASENEDIVESPASNVWGVVDDSETFVGYRIGEELATIGTAEAVGRTSSVTGSVVISGTIVERATIEANLLDLESDDSRRDQTLQDRGLESATFPTATFELTSSIELGDDLTDGAIYSVVAAGDLTLHGVTRPVEMQMEAQYIGGSLVIVGSLDIVLADYDIVAPTTRIALSVDDHGTMEMQLILARNG